MNEREMRDRFEQEVDRNGGILWQDIAFAIEAQAGKDDDRTVSGLASVEGISRNGILFEIKGIELAEYKKNPVVLAAHQTVAWNAEPTVIAQATSITKGQDELRIKMAFDTDRLADAWYQKVRKGFVRMMSIGPHPIDYEFDEMTVGRGANKRTVPFMRVTRCELVEVSVCAVGRNRGAFFEPPKEQAESLIRMSAELARLQAELADIRGVMDATAAAAAEIVQSQRLDTARTAGAVSAHLLVACEALGKLQSVAKECEHGTHHHPDHPGGGARPAGPAAANR